MASATLALASKVWGSVLGLFRIDVTLTYFPPIWLNTLAYSFSAPTAMMGPDLLVLADADAAVRPATASADAARTPERASFAATPAERTTRGGSMKRGDVVMTSSVDLD